MRDSPSLTKLAVTLVSHLIGIAVVTTTLAPQGRAQGFSGLATRPNPVAQARTVASEPRAASEPVQPVSAVDLQRFLGEWYEIARIPAWFQNRCVKDTTARYQLRSDGKITVTNRCITRKGEVQQADGLARVVDPATKARLKVSFVSVLGWRPFWGDYWVIGLDPEYRWMVVGDPKRHYGWILSRSASMEPAQLESAFQALDRNGYPRASFVLTPHS